MDRFRPTKWWGQAEAEVEAKLMPKKGRGWHSLRRKFASDFMHQPLKVLCELAGWKSPQTILTCYQQPDEQQIRAALSDRRRVVNSGSPALGPRKNPAQSSKTKRGSHFTKWAWEDLNFRPHVYQAGPERAHSRQETT